MGSATTTKEIHWRTPELDVLLTIDQDDVVCIRSILPHGTKPEKASSPFYSDPAIPLHQVRLTGEGNFKHKTSRTLIASYVSGRLKYRSHAETAEDGARKLEVVSHDAETGLTVTATLTIYSGIPVTRATSSATNDGAEDLRLTHIGPLTVGGLTSSTRQWWHDWTLSYANNTWFREAQWTNHSLTSLGLDDFGIIELNQGHPTSHASFSLQSHGSFSTGEHLPIGLLKRHDDRETWLWTIESPTSWRYEIGDYFDSIYVSCSGPTQHNHNWHVTLRPGETINSPAAATIQHNFSAPTTAFQHLTSYRRRIRRPHPDNANLPVIFNDYMNCLMGDPTEEKIKSLLPAVVASGAEYFVIDCGWYADDTDWWYDVGEWTPSKKRFPSGFANLLGYIRSQGLIPGLWLEPEVVGVNSPVATQLPDEAFFQDHGKRVVEKGRYQLDFRHPAVIERMNGIIHTLVTKYGAGYFKFDYNIDVIQGTTANTQAQTPTAAATGHSIAYQAWLSHLLQRYPGLVIESCSSGAQRMEYSLLSILPIQSTSDQQDPVRYAAIAANIFSAVAPEQAASWAYPQANWSDEINALTMVNTMLGRVMLSGTLDKLSERQATIVRDGIDVYKSIRGQIKHGLPFWPLGFAEWHDGWVCVGLEVPSKNEAPSGNEVEDKKEVLLAVWRRAEYVPETPEEVFLPIEALAGGAGTGEMEVGVELLFPKGEGFEVEFDWVAAAAAAATVDKPVEGRRTTAGLRVKLKSLTAARLFRLTRRQRARSAM
jgi:alpha-galactosidase